MIRAIGLCRIASLRTGLTRILVVETAVWQRADRFRTRPVRRSCAVWSFEADKGCDVVSVRIPYLASSNVVN